MPKQVFETVDGPIHLIKVAAVMSNDSRLTFSLSNRIPLDGIANGERLGSDDLLGEEQKGRLANTRPTTEALEI